MAADPRGEGHRCCREEGQEDRAVQYVEGDCLAPLATGRDMKDPGIIAACGHLVSERSNPSVLNHQGYDPVD